MADDRSRSHRHGSSNDAPSGAVATLGDGLPSLSAGEAAAALGLSERRLRRAIARGELSADRDGAGFRIYADEVIRYARQNDLPIPLSPRARVVALPLLAEAASALPISGSRLIGRDTEVGRLVPLLEDPTVQLVTLTGPGGIGKTRLALAAAEAMQGRFRHGAIFVDLSAVGMAEEAIPAIAQALGLREHAGQDRLSQIAGFLRAKHLLLVLDNVEQIIAAAPRIAQLNAQAPGVTLLVTSRALLRVRGEREVPVPPLPLPSSDATPDELLASDAGRLFVERAQEHDSHFHFDEQSAPLIAEICARLDGLPLAIELAAARARLLTLRQLRDRLDRKLSLLTHGGRDAPPRHLTMRDAIAWSYDLLSEDERLLFRQLSVFVGGFTLDAAEWLGGREFVLDLLEALLEQSLVTRDVGIDGEPRFRMLETIREYGLERLEADEHLATREAHARYFGALAQALRLFVVTEAAREPLERLAADDPNLRAALAWFDERGLAADFVAMAAACCNYWTAYSLLNEGGVWVNRALAKQELATPVNRARLLLGAAKLLFFQGESTQAESAFAEGLDLSREVADPLDLAMALTSHGAFFNHQKRYPEAETLLNEGGAVAETIADPRLRAIAVGLALANLSVAARGRGDLALATTRCEEALACYKGHGFDLAETRALMDLAGIAKDQGDHRLMVERYQASLARTGKRGDMRLVSVAASGIASAATAWGQSRTALLLYGATDALRERVGLAMALSSDVATTERDLNALRVTLGDAEYATTMTEGRALPLEEALAMAAAVSPVAKAPPAAHATATIQLTRREQDILRLIAEGLTDREIAEALFIGPRTVSWHVGAILAKLDASTRLKAVNRARKAGLI